MTGQMPAQSMPMTGPMTGPMPDSMQGTMPGAPPSQNMQGQQSQNMQGGDASQQGGDDSDMQHELEWTEDGSNIMVETYGVFCTSDGGVINDQLWALINRVYPGGWQGAKKAGIIRLKVLERPCLSAGCSYQSTGLEKDYCCPRCKNNPGKHGPMCQKLEMPDAEDAEPADDDGEECKPKVTNLVPEGSKILGDRSTWVTHVREKTYEQVAEAEDDEETQGLFEMDEKKKMYGAATMAAMNAGVNKLHPLVLVAATFQPVLVYAISFVCFCTPIRYKGIGGIPGFWFCAILCVIIGSFISMEWCTMHSDTTTAKGRAQHFMVASNLCALVVGAGLGEATFGGNFKPYYDYHQLAHYPGVDPSSFRGQAFNDAGQIDFFFGSHLDLKRSYGFKNGDHFCVSPIVGPTVWPNPWPTGPMPKQDNYDFWAIGVNCCSAHSSDYHCGEWSNFWAHKGLRLTRDDLRGYFRLAVESASAQYNITARNPTFVYFMQNPEQEVNSYLHDGWAEFIHGAMGYLFLQTIVTTIAGMCWINGSPWDAPKSSKRYTSDAS